MRQRHIRNDASLDCYFCTTLKMLLPICATKIFCSSPQTVAGCARADLVFYGLPPLWYIYGRRLVTPAPTVTVAQLPLYQTREKYISKSFWFYCVSEGGGNSDVTL